MGIERAELGAFLRSRREQLTPAQAGLTAFPGPRRVPGLRREELAYLAGVSPAYYSRLEQGRQANVSASVLGSLVRALRLDDVEQAHLRDLAAPVGGPGRGAPEAPQRADPGLLRVMGALDEVPVLLVGNRGEVLARNALLSAVLGAALEPGSSFVRFLLQDPVARRRITNWPTFAASMVASLRRELGRRPHDARLAELVEELRRGDAAVAAWWGDHGVRDYASVAKRVAHPEFGALAFDIEVVTAPHEHDQRLVVYTAQPGSRTAEALPLLRSWHAEAPSPA